jgi:hypothetical protein
VNDNDYDEDPVLVWPRMQARACDLTARMSTWDPYQVVVMRTDLKLRAKAK